MIRLFPAMRSSEPSRHPFPTIRFSLAHLAQKVSNFFPVVFAKEPDKEDSRRAPPPPPGPYAPPQVGVANPPAPRGRNAPPQVVIVPPLPNPNPGFDPERAVKEVNEGLLN